MLVFLIPLKSQQVSHSWDAVCELFERCVRSVCNQTNSDFRAIVICHEMPAISFTHPNLIYIQVDFPIPTSDWKIKELDKTQKILTGILRARELNASHVMVVDADDCVNKHLAEFVNDHPNQDGWFVSRGYVYDQKYNLLRIMRKSFDQYCGTSYLTKISAYDRFKTASKEDAISYIASYTHRRLKTTLEAQGMQLEKLPFSGAIYTTQHGENLNQQFVSETRKPISLKGWLLRFKMLFDHRFLSRKVVDEFGLYRI